MAWFCGISLCLIAPLRAADGLQVVLTADNEGHVDPCQLCPMHAGFGGLARRSTVLTRLRGTGPLLLDAGNAFFGSDSVDSRGEVIVAAYNALGYDAVNLAYCDFRFGKEQTLALAHKAKFTVLSANLLDAQTGAPLVLPYCIIKRPDARVALVGVTERPAGLDFLPHLKQQLAGIRIQPPADALGQWLPKAKAESDRIILLYYGSSSGLAAIQQKFGDQFAAILVGGIRPDELPAGATPPVVGAEEHGKSIASLTLSAAKPATVEQLLVTPDLAADPAMLQLLANFQPKPSEVAAAPPAPTLTSPPADPREQLERAFAILQQADSQIPPDSYDPVAVVQNLGGRLDDLFAWVRDNTRWVPYRGALRGPAVLIDRVGNSLDRSLLLAEFYHHTPANFRLAHATLSTEQAKALLEKIRTAPRPAGISFETRDGAGPMGIAAAQRLDRLGDGLTQRAAAEMASLSAVMGSSNLPPGSADDEALAALSDHWWVQRSDGNHWVDLDVTLPGAKPGDTVCPATETFPLDGLAKDLWHTLRIAVVAERWADGKLTQSTVLSRTVRPGLVVGGTIYLTHVPLEWAHDPSAGTSAEAVKAARAQALMPTEWVPTLKLGIEMANDAGIRPDGSVDPKPQLDPTARMGTGAGESSGSAAAVFDSPPVSASTASAAPTGLFTAEWVEYTLRTPGVPDETIRREVFDLIGPAARAAGVPARPAPDELARANAALALRGRIDIVALPCQLSPAFVSHTLLHSLVNSKSALVQALAALRQPGGAEAEFDVPPPCPSPLYGLALLRRLYSPTAADWYIARPNVFTYHSFARLTPDGHQDYCEATDLVTNDVAIEPWSKIDPAKLRRDQGVLDTAAEGALLPAGGERVSASETLAAAASQSLELVTARTPADLERVKATPDDMARLRAAVSSGRIVVVPAAPIRLGTADTIAWWEIDPATGRTLGIGQQGWGTDMAEYAAIIQRWVMAHKRFVCLGAAAATVLNVISPLFGLNELEGDALSAVQTALDAACAGA